jgi:methylisocitrate lyase
MTRSQALSKAGRLRDLLATKTIAVPGAFNAMAAIQIERAGYDALYVSGAALSAGRGLPDIGLLSLEEVVAEAERIAKAVSIPTIVDADTGFGPPSAVPAAVRAFERAGLAGMQIEDQQLPKKCGHLPGKELVPAEVMASKIHAAVEARRDPEFLIVARTDARSVEGLEAAVHRALAYAEAGADALFPEALESEEEFRTFALAMGKAGITVPLIANMTEFGKSPYLTVGQFERLGYRGILFPVSLLRVAMRAMERFLSELRNEGSQRDWLQQMMTRAELYELLRYEPETMHEGRSHEQSDRRATRD